jgi:hypothetical protein
LWNSITKPNGYRNSHRDCNCNRNSNRHSDGDRNGNSYGYAKTHANPETPSHTKATSYPTASSVTEFLLGEFSSKRTTIAILGSFNQEMRNLSPGKRIPAFLLS